MNDGRAFSKSQNQSQGMRSQVHINILIQSLAIGGMSVDRVKPTSTSNVLRTDSPPPLEYASDSCDEECDNECIICGKVWFEEVIVQEGITVGGERE